MKVLRNLATLASVAALLAYFWWQGERFIAANGPTFDEGVHLTAGYAQWTRGDFALNREDPPLVKLLWALPLVLGERPPWPVETSAERNHWQLADAFLYHSKLTPQQLLNPARRVNLALGCGVVLLVGWWAYRAWRSRLAGIAACAFAVCDPNLLALSCVLSTDLGLAFFTLIGTYLLWEYAAAPSRGLLLASGIALGCLLSAKFSSLAVVAALAFTGLVVVLRGGVLALPGKVVNADPRSRLGAAFDLAFRLAVIAFVTLTATYGFIHFEQWGAGLKFQLTRGDFGDGVAYLSGKRSRTGWYHYFLVVLALKLPLGLLLASASGACQRTVSSRNAFVFFPPLVFLVLASLARVNLGIRVVLPAIPFLYLFAARLAAPGCCRVVRSVWLLGSLAWVGVASWQAAPHQIAYFNELAGGSRSGLNYAADSNLDWGQGLPLLKQYMEREGIDVVYLSYFGSDRPEAHGIRFHALPGYGRVGETGGERIPRGAPRHVLAISANHLVGLMLEDPNTFTWLRDREPDAVLGGCIYIFDITGDAAAIARVR